MRATWLADVLRRAGCRVVEVDGWKTRGSAEFDPIGVTWHATAGSRTSTAAAEVRVLLNGSATAPPPIAQLLLDRTGTFHVVAAGRCNHNKVGWDGPNKGLGNSRLFGIEMMNDNKGEPWPAAQLDAARRGTAAIMREIGADPMRRLAAHYEHQPYATRPLGEGSTKSDPHGVVMTQERPKVAALMRGEDDVSQADVIAALESADGQAAIQRAVNRDAIQRYSPVTRSAIPEDPDDPGADDMTWASALAFSVMFAEFADHEIRNAVKPKLDLILAEVRALAGKDVVDEAALAAALLPMLGRSDLVNMIRASLTDPADRAALAAAIAAP